jgi:hypothetical protein
LAILQSASGHFAPDFGLAPICGQRVKVWLIDALPGQLKKDDCRQPGAAAQAGAIGCKSGPDIAAARTGVSASQEKRSGFGQE